MLFQSPSSALFRFIQSDLISDFAPGSHVFPSQSHLPLTFFFTSNRNRGPFRSAQFVSGSSVLRLSSVLLVERFVDITDSLVRITFTPSAMVKRRGEFFLIVSVYMIANLCVSITDSLAAIPCAVMFSSD